MAECFCKSSGMALCASCRIAELEAKLAEVESCRKAANNALWEKSQAYELIRADWRHAVMDASQLRKDIEEMTKDRDIHKGMATGYMQLASKHESERDELTKQLADLRGDRDTLAARLAADHRFSEAPCPICDYNGPGYFQPSTHPCAAMFHAAMDKRNHEANQNELDAAASGALTRAGKDRT